MSETRSDKPAILLVEDDEEIREGIVQFLKTIGYDVAWATNEADSILEIANSHFRIGLFLVDQDMSSDEALAVGRRLRTHVRMGENIPVVVIPLEFSKELEGKDEDVGQRDYKTYLSSCQQLATLLSRLLPLKQ
jgi:CheY-like chemotaxis protein